MVRYRTFLLRVDQHPVLARGRSGGGEGSIRAKHRSLQLTLSCCHGHGDPPRGSISAGGIGGGEEPSLEHTIGTLFKDCDGFESFVSLPNIFLVIQGKSFVIVLLSQRKYFVAKLTEDSNPLYDRAIICKVLTVEVRTERLEIQVE